MLNTHELPLSSIAATLEMHPQFEGDKEKVWAMVHDLSDIHSSTISLGDEHHPKLLNQGLSGLELDDLVWDIGEDLRHILYHIATNECLRRLLDIKLQGSNVSNVLLDKWPQLQNDKEKMDAFSRELAGVIELTSRYREDLYPRLQNLGQGLKV